MDFLSGFGQALTSGLDQAHGAVKSAAGLDRVPRRDAPSAQAAEAGQAQHTGGVPRASAVASVAKHSPNSIMARLLDEETEYSEQVMAADEKFSRRSDAYIEACANPRCDEKQKESIKFEVRVLNDKAKEKRMQLASHRRKMEDFRQKHADQHTQAFFIYDLRQYQERKKLMMTKAAEFQRMAAKKHVYGTVVRETVDVQRIMTGYELSRLETEIEEFAENARAGGLSVPENYLGDRQAPQRVGESSTKSPARAGASHGTSPKASLGRKYSLVPGASEGSTGNTIANLKNRRSSQDTSPISLSEERQRLRNRRSSLLSTDSTSPLRGSDSTPISPMKESPMRTGESPASRNRRNSGQLQE